MQFSKFQPRRLPIFWARLAGGGMDRSGAGLNGTAPDLPIEQGLTPAAPVGAVVWRPLPQNRAVKTGLHDVSVVPVPARPIELRRAVSAGENTRVERVS